MQQAAAAALQDKNAVSSKEVEPDLPEVAANRDGLSSSCYKPYFKCFEVYGRGFESTKQQGGRRDVFKW